MSFTECYRAHRWSYFKHDLDCDISLDCNSALIHTSLAALDKMLNFPEVSFMKIVKEKPTLQSSRVF